MFIDVYSIVAMIFSHGTVVTGSVALVVMAALSNAFEMIL